MVQGFKGTQARVRCLGVVIGQHCIERYRHGPFPLMESCPFFIRWTGGEQFNNQRHDLWAFSSYFPLRTPAFSGGSHKSVTHPPFITRDVNDLHSSEPGNLQLKLQLTLQWSKLEPYYFMLSHIQLKYSFIYLYSEFSWAKWFNCQWVSLKLSRV